MSPPDFYCEGQEGKALAYEKYREAFRAIEKIVVEARNSPMTKEELIKALSHVLVRGAERARIAENEPARQRLSEAHRVHEMFLD